MPSLTVCMMVQNSEKTLAIALESLANIYDELIIVDGGSNDCTYEIAKKYGAKIIHSTWTGNHSYQRNVYLKYINTDWVFVIDSDEFVTIKVVEFLQDLKNNNFNYDFDNFWICRKWISPFSKNNYITSKPHFPDFQRRLFKYNKNIFYEGQIHEVIHNLISEGECLPNLSLYHLDLFINNKNERLEKIRRYSQIDPRNGARHYYLPNDNQLTVEEWDYAEVSLEVQMLLEDLFNSLIEKSELNRLIPAEIKNDEFYYQIQQLAQRADIETILEIGSSSGEGSTDAFVKGIQNNYSKHPILFCMEVSKNRFQELSRKYQNQSFVKCYNISSVSITDFPEESEVIEFYNTNKTGLNSYPIELVLTWLQQDIEYIKNSGVADAGIKRIKEDNKIEYFDVVLIDGSEFTGIAELNELYGAKYICLDDINTFKNYQNYHKLLESPEYSLITSNRNIRNGYAIFQRKSIQQITYENACVHNGLSNISLTSNADLPIHFFTIVLNGEPFIKYHIEAFKHLPFKWHWHIVEGVADLKNDTAWSINLGGYISQKIHINGLSNDGTTEYLNELREKYPQNITIYRKPNGSFWNGKREMVNEPLFNINEECLLWQIDTDELWTTEQICAARQMFIDNPNKTAAFYWCWYFVGNNLIISTRNCYTQNPHQEWLRTWRYKPGAVWVAHEPPRLEEPLLNGQWLDIAKINPFLHHETESKGLIFQHFAYVTPEQLQFKQEYYGYSNAVAQWLALQANSKFPTLLRDYFTWVGDDTMVDISQYYGVIPIAQREAKSNNWYFLQPEEIREQKNKIQKIKPIIIVDGVFFQLYKTGIARVWRSLLQKWANTDFANHILVLDRSNTAPKINGIRYRAVSYYDYNNAKLDKQMLQEICDEEGAELLVSTYYTTPIDTPSVFMAYDMIPEVLGANLNEVMWREKHHSIKHASAYISISENTAKDLNALFPHIPFESITIAHCGVDTIFYPAAEGEIKAFKYKYGINKPYFLLVGTGTGYKNSILFFQAFSQLASRYGFDIICTGIGGVLAPEFRAYTSGSTVHLLQLSDEELVLAYSGAVALVYPSKYEGFGMPVLEAMACGCPVITCPNASIPEVTGEAAIYVNDNDVEALANALCEVQKPSIRQSLINAGLSQAKKFSWTKMAQTVSSALINATLLPLNLKEINLIIFPDWSQPEEQLGLEMAEIIKALASHPHSSKTTLLISISSINAEDAAMFLSSVTMNLLIEENLDISEDLEITPIENLAAIQWEVLLPRIYARIILPNENKQTLAALPIGDLQSYELDDCINKISTTSSYYTRLTKM
ncbi:group 1 glycosyl transferase [Nostoc carneum NIES-2107]|nr:group 1 glycosyl transferase [Nostoc carneum NIES-2107]